MKIIDSIFTQNDATAIANATNATITGNTFTYNHLGIKVSRGTNTITNNTISNNTGITVGNIPIGGISANVKPGSAIVISNNEINDNNQSGIGIKGQWSDPPSVMTISNNNILRNASGGIRYGHGSNTGDDFFLNITDNTIDNNSAVDGGGIYIGDSSAAATITGNQIDSNLATNGSALFFHGDTGSQYQDLIENNNVTGATETSLLYLYQGGETIRNNNFTHTSETYLVYEDSTGLAFLNAPRFLENNWWGTTSDSELQNLI